MSVEKLRADLADFEADCENPDHCPICARKNVLLALLDEHAAEEEQTDLALRNERHDRAEALIQAYGEDE